MPELPDLVHIEARLQSCAGWRISEVQIKEPIVLRNLTGGPGLDVALKGRRLTAIKRHGPFLRFAFGELDLIIHPMLAGRFSLGPDGSRRALCFELRFEEGVLRYLDDKKMGKVYLTRSGETAAIPGYDSQGVNIISAEFSEAEFLARIQASRQQVRAFLMDQTRLSAIGNAYADEILFDARLHPKALCTRLDEAARRRLYASVRSVIQRGIAAVESANRPLEDKVRDHMQVRNRKDEPCPRCRTKIRRANVLGWDSFFCPQCQPDSRKSLIDWSTTTKPSKS